MSAYATRLRNYTTNRATPQSEPIPGKTMVKNSAGGYGFAVDDWTRLDRFLVLGTEGGTYYASEKTLTIQNAETVKRLIALDGPRVVQRVVEISDAGRAPKNDPAIFVLAAAASFGDRNTKRLAGAALPKVCRIGTHLYHFAAFVDGFRGWGRGLREAVQNWYVRMPVDRLAQQAIKYKSRDGWAHKDLLRLSHAKTDEPARDAVFRYMSGGMDAVQSTHRMMRVRDQRGQFVKNEDGTFLLQRQERPLRTFDLPEVIRVAERLDASTEVSLVVKAIREHSLPREALPTQFLNDVRVWEALLEDMPMTAMIRNLGKMSEVGLLAPLSAASRRVTDQLGNAEALRRARVHPLALLAALVTYQRGAGVRGSLTWNPVQNVVDALDAAFYASFGNVTPTGRNVMLALDISGSMGGGEIAGIPGMSPRVGSAAMALITANVESNYLFTGFSTNMIELKISPKQRLADVVKTISGLPFGGTDCAQPMLYAMEKKLPVDVFAVYTDNETWAGHIHPSQALQRYRQTTGRVGKLAVVGMTATGFSIADPADAGMMDFVGFDTNAPEIMSDFFRG